jgi:hypothetical protein
MSSRISSKRNPAGCEFTGPDMCGWTSHVSAQLNQRLSKAQMEAYSGIDLGEASQIHPSTPPMR